MEFEDSKGRKYTSINDFSVKYRGIYCDGNHRYIDYDDNNQCIDNYLDVIDAIVDRVLIDYILNHSFNHYLFIIIEILGLNNLNGKYGISDSSFYGVRYLVIRQNGSELKIMSYENNKGDVHKFELGNKSIVVIAGGDLVNDLVGKYLISTPTKSARNFN